MEKQAVSAPPARAGARLFFVDNIRVLLTILVILHHLMITYAGTGDWYYNEGREDIVSTALGGWFCATNQAYFMGLFLLISAYFIPGSYDRKGAGRFVRDRLIRLGIPLAIYSWVISPVFVYLLHADEIGMPFWQYFPVEYFRHAPLIGAGPLWFVEVLLIFSLAYAAVRLLFGSREAAAPRAAASESFPGTESEAGLRPAAHRVSLRGRGRYVTLPHEHSRWVSIEWVADPE